MPRHAALHALNNPKQPSQKDLAARRRSPRGITVRRALLNTIDGKLLVEGKTRDSETTEQWLKAQGVEPTEWLELMEYEIIDGKLIIA